MTTDGGAGTFEHRGKSAPRETPAIDSKYLVEHIPPFERRRRMRRC
jgi:hypothetical protein